ncbi:hypothetical protein [Paenibacillus sp. J22TS3]|uniref:hypothetical protein n=1 Tax=Paenibacillus sp. J22TS3 TaxID=2807192 RepID=UPI001B0847A7|nr:hypothetical protein [Paenibacillus sp. J22TS3]GIP23479.1 hypothetical protein J22TS3_37540 [Paenibacillus sp. J22TS3]
MDYVWIALLVLIIMGKRQLAPRPVSARIVTVPLILALYGGYLAAKLSVGVGETASLLIGLGLGAAVGLYQGRFVRVFEQGGVWMTQGSVVTLGIWLLSIPLRLVIKYGFTELFHIPVKLTGSYMFVPYLFSLSGIMLGRAAYLIIKYPDEFQQAAGISRQEKNYINRGHRF